MWGEPPAMSPPSRSTVRKRPRRPGGRSASASACTSSPATGPRSVGGPDRLLEAMPRRGRRQRPEARRHAASRSVSGAWRPPRRPAGRPRGRPQPVGRLRSRAQRGGNCAGRQPRRGRRAHRRVPPRSASTTSSCRASPTSKRRTGSARASSPACGPPGCWARRPHPPGAAGLRRPHPPGSVAPAAAAEPAANGPAVGGPSGAGARRHPPSPRRAPAEPADAFPPSPARDRPVGAAPSGARRLSRPRSTDTAMITLAIGPDPSPLPSAGSPGLRTAAPGRRLRYRPGRWRRPCRCPPTCSPTSRRSFATARPLWSAVVRHDPDGRRPVRLIATERYEVWAIGWTTGQNVRCTITATRRAPSP